MPSAVVMEMKGGLGTDSDMSFRTTQNGQTLMIVAIRHVLRVRKLVICLLIQFLNFNLTFFDFPLES